MKRYRWLTAEWPFSMRVLAKRLKENAFDNNSSDGFVLDRVRDDFLQARFVERFEYDEQIADPFGQELSFHRVDFKQCEFRASTQMPGLELVDAPRSPQTVVSRLAQLSDFSLAVSPISTNVLNWATAFQREIQEIATVQSVQIGAVELVPGVVAKAVIRGEANVLEASNELTRGRSHVLERLLLVFGSSKRLRVTLTNVASASVEGDTSERILPALRNSISSTLAGSSIS